MLGVFVLEVQELEEERIFDLFLGRQHIVGRLLLSLAQHRGLVLRERRALVELATDLPIELAQLDDVRNGRLLAADKLGGRNSSTQSAVKADSSKSLAGEQSAVRRVDTSVAEKKSVGVASGPAPKAAALAVKGPQDSKEQPAKQVTFDLPREALAQNSLNQQSRNRGTARNLNRTQAADEQRSMHVLFVVVEQAQASTQLAPNNAPKSAVPAKTRTEPAKPAGQDGAA